MASEPDGITASRLDVMSRRIRSFREGGGAIRRPLDDPAELRAWQTEVEDYLRRFREMKLADKYPVIEAGLEMMSASLKRPLCLVALRAAECHAALSYYFRKDNTIWVGAVGSKGRPEAKGAGTALEYELAVLAAERGHGVRSFYLPDVRAWHVDLCRRVDVDLRKGTSIWTKEDCVEIRDGIRSGLER